MEILTKLCVGLVAIEHVYILWLEMFAWETRGKKTFKDSLPEHMFAPTKRLAANQGLYNGFLAAGLIWTFFISDPLWQFYIRVFFLTCISVAGVYGALSASKKIFYIQALPAIITLVLLHIR